LHLDLRVLYLYLVVQNRVFTQFIALLSCHYGHGALYCVTLSSTAVNATGVCQSL